MRKLIWLRSAPVLALVLAGPAAATTLLSQTLREAKGDSPSCNIVNAGTQQITVTAELLDGVGQVADEVTFAVPPGGESGALTGGVTGNFECRLSGAFNKRNVRASMPSDARTDHSRPPSLRHLVLALRDRPFGGSAGEPNFATVPDRTSAHGEGSHSLSLRSYGRAGTSDGTSPTPPVNQCSLFACEP